MEILSAAAAFVGLVIGIRDARVTLYDDAAITMRYSFRLAHGGGWTYNDGDRTNGASAPLYTIVLAIGSLLGADLVQLARVLGAALFAVTLGLVFYLSARVSGVFSGLLAVIVLAGVSDYRLQALSGMESALAASLGLASIALLVGSHDRSAGLALGLALFNKLDAGLLAVAIGAACLLVTRRPPWRVMLVSLGVISPWLAFSQSYFGSIVPYAASQKLGPVKTGLAHSGTWMIDAIRHSYGDHLLSIAGCLCLFALPLLWRQNPRLVMAFITCLLWPLAVVIVFQQSNIDPYPWYKTVLYPPISILIAVPFGVLLRYWSSRGSRPFLSAAAVACLATLIVANARLTELQATAKVVYRGHAIDGYEAFEETRRQAGRFVAARSEPGDVILTCFGWVAYEALSSPIKEVCPLCTRKDPGQPRWYVGVSFPGYQEPAPPAGSALIASFRSETDPGGGTFVFEFQPTAPKGRQSH